MNSGMKGCVAFALGLAAMGAGALAQDGTVRVVAASSGSGNALVELAKAYVASHPGSNVEVQQIPVGESYTQAILGQLQGGAGPDIIFTNAGYGAPESLVPLGASGALLDLSSESWAAGIPADARADFGAQQAIWGLPLALLSVAIIYNADVVADLGVALPATYPELLKLCATAKAVGKSAFGVPGSNPYFFIQAIAAQTVYADDPAWNQKRQAGEVTFEGTEGWHVALDRYQEMAKQGCFFPGFEVAGVSQLFAAIAGGDVLMAIGPTTLMGGVKAMNPAINLKMAPFPGETADTNQVIAFYNDAVGVNVNAAEPEAAKAFIAWLAEPEQLAEYSNIAGGVPPGDVALLKFPEALRDLVPSFEAGRTISAPHFGWPSAEVRAELVRGASGLVTGQTSTADVLRAMDAAWQ
jgi:raffinose/stachyose/melibiose transport system substrate-binding protein